MEYIYAIAEEQVYKEDINRFYFTSEEKAKSVFEKIKLLDDENYIFKKIKVSESKDIISQIIVKAWIYRDRAEYDSYISLELDTSLMRNFYTLGLDSYVYNCVDDDEDEECCHIHIGYTFFLDDIDVKHKEYAKKIEQHIEDLIKEEGYNSFFNHTEKEIKEKLKGIKLE